MLIDQRHVGGDADLVHQRQRLFAGAGVDHVQAPFLQQLAEGQPQRVVILDQEHDAVLWWRGRGRAKARRVRQGGRRSGAAQADRETGAPAGGGAQGERMA